MRRHLHTGHIAEVIRQTCLSPLFGMIGQQLRAADAAFPVINRTFTQPQTPRKVFSTISSACHPPDSCPMSAEAIASCQVSSFSKLNIVATVLPPQLSTLNPHLLLRKCLAANGMR